MESIYKTVIGFRVYSLFFFFFDLEISRFMSTHSQTFMHQHQQNEMVLLSFEYNTKLPGLRKFLITTWRHFYQVYKHMNLNQRVYYECILENRPCRLYFDIEYSKHLNADLDGEFALKLLKEFVVLEIKKRFASQKECQMDNQIQDMVDLDSSTDSKFSHHLILNVYFTNNSHAGRFVQYLIHEMSIHSENINSEWNALKCLYIKTDKGFQWMIDEGVYSRNRNFRLYLSSKLDKHIPLKISDSSGRIPKGCGIRNGKLCKMWSHGMYSDLEASDEDQFEFFKSTLVCPWPLSFPDILLCDFGNDVPQQMESKWIRSNFQMKKVSLENQKPSPFPLVDGYLYNFIHSLDHSTSNIRMKSCFYESSNSFLR